MVFITSMAGEIEDYLIARLQDRSGLAGVQVEIGPLGNDTAASEWIQTGGEPGPLSADQAWVTNRSKEERIRLSVLIFVERPGAGPEVIREVRERANELKSEIETEIRENRNQPGEFGWRWEFLDYTVERGVGPGGSRWELIRCGIECKSRLRET